MRFDAPSDCFARVRRHRKWLALAGAAILAAALAPVAWHLRGYASPDRLQELAKSLASVGPAPFFALMCAAPLFGAPVSPFLLVSPAFGTLAAAVGCFLALTSNLAISWLVSSKLFRPFVLRALGRFGYSEPKLPRANMMGVALMLRLTPGMPLAASNYLLGAANMPFWPYMAVSVPLVCATSAGVVLLGDALMKGSAAIGLGAVAALVAVALAIRAARARMRARALLEELDGPL